MGLRSAAKGKQVNLFHAASATVASDARLMAASYRQRLGLHAKVVSDKQDATFGLFWCNCRMMTRWPIARARGARDSPQALPG